LSGIRPFEEKPTAFSPQPNCDHGGPAGVTILLVEDQDFVREVTGEVLEFEGFRVLKARSAVEAARLFHAGEVQLLLTDVVLPGRNGCRLAHDLVAVCPALKVVFISGYPENEIARHRLEEDGAMYLSKPFSVEGLMRVVRSALNKSNGQVPANGNGQEQAKPMASSS
jgi:DNA-binding NtrC family response regulator